jgi:hypothetical protein
VLNRVLPVFLFILLTTLGLTVWILHRQREWVDVGQRAMVIVHPATGEISTPLTIAVWHPETSEVLLLPLPESLMFRASHNGESYPVSGLPRLAEIENWSTTRWQRELSLQLGVVFDGSLHVSSPQTDFDLDELEAQSLQALLGGRQTSLVMWDRWTWLQALQNADDLKSRVITFESGWLDGDKHLNEAVYDRFARLRLQDETLRNSQWTLRVVNASGIAGDASRQARMLELIGYGVRAVESQDEMSLSTVVTLPRLAEDDAADVWARSRLQVLYADWFHEENDGLFEKQRVQGEVISGSEKVAEL